jgi:cell division protein FtsX
MSRAEIEILHSVGRRPSQIETFPFQNVGMEFDLHGFLATALYIYIYIYIRRQYRYASLNDGDAF